MFRRALGGLLLLLAALAGAVGGLWAFMKAAGAEVDYCPGSGCTSGWYLAVGLLTLALAAGVAGVALLRGERSSRA
jgi:hypothetical protein